VSDNRNANFIIGKDDLILVTGAAGFIGKKVVQNLLRRGYRNLRCLARSSNSLCRIDQTVEPFRKSARVEVVKGNLLSRKDCLALTRGVEVVYHLAAARGEKSFPEAFMNSVVTTRNLIESALQEDLLKRFVNVSSFAVYANTHKRNTRLLDESCPIEAHPELRGSAYDFAKAKQEELVNHYAKHFGLPSVIVRPGYVFGPGNEAITGRVGISPFGVFLHLGGPNRIPFTYIDNCADAIALAGLVEGIEGEIFNVVDDDLPTSRGFLHQYKKNVRRFASLYIPHAISYIFCLGWESYSAWSHGQLPPVYNRKLWHASWKKTNYSNKKIKARLGWSPVVPMRDALVRYFRSCAERLEHA
jgi:nucleoside-diphosphate-sugar epimerase